MSCNHIFRMQCDLRLVCDIVRGKIICHDIATLLAVLAELAELQTAPEQVLRIRIVSAKNRLGKWIVLHSAVCFCYVKCDF